jgi:hypothetical protein
MAYVQSTSATSASAASQAVTFAGTPVAGNLVVVAIQLVLAGGASVSTVVDNKGNTYALVKAQAYGAAGADDLEVWEAHNIASSATFTVTVTPASASAIAVSIHEYSNQRTNAGVDKTVSATSTSAAPDSGATAATTRPLSLVFSAVGVAGAVPAVTAGTGFTVRENPNIAAVLELGTEDKTATGLAAQDGTFTLGASSLWGCIVATFPNVARQESTAGANVDLQAASNRQVSTVGATVDLKTASNRQVSTAGANVDMSNLSARIATTVGANVDFASKVNRQVSTIGVNVDIKISTKRVHHKSLGRQRGIVLYRP